MESSLYLNEEEIEAIALSLEICINMAGLTSSEGESETRKLLKTMQEVLSKIESSDMYYLQ